MPAAAGTVWFAVRRRRTPRSTRGLVCVERTPHGRVRRRRPKPGEIAVAETAPLQDGGDLDSGPNAAVLPTLRFVKHTPARRRLLRSLVVIVLIASAGAALMVRAAGHSDPVSLDDVLARFRDQGSAGGTSAPAAGVYTYRVTGSEAGGTGPFKVRRDFPETATVTVRRTSTGWETETNLSEQHVEGARFRLNAGAIEMVWRREDVTFAGLGRDDRRDIAGRYRIAPVDPRPGERFTDTYLAGSLRNRVQTDVVRREQVRVGGVGVPVVVLTSKTRTTGALSGSRDETVWWSSELRVPVRVTQRVTIGGVVAFDSRLEMTLQGLTPAT